MLQKTTVIIGGGISGLTAALFAKMKNRKSNVILLEATDRLGGWVQSKRFPDGSVHELGPRTIRMQSPTINSMLKIIDNVNISDKIISISKSNKIFQKRYIFAHDNLHLLDFSLLKPAKVPFTESMLKKVVRASLKKYKHENYFQDLPVDYFFRTRFGNEIADYIVNPVIRGIYACDSRDLSMLATFGGMLEFEKLGHNVVIGALRNYLQNLFRWNDVTNECHSLQLKTQVKDASIISFKGGMKTLIDNIEAAALSLDIDICTDSIVHKVILGNDNKLVVQLQNKTIQCDRVVCAVPSHVAKHILHGVSSSIDYLSNIQWTTVAVVVLEFNGCLLTNQGFGHLIPSWVIGDVLGVIYDSCILPENDCTKRNATRFTVMLGGSWFTPNISAMNSDQLIEKAVDVLRVQMKITGQLVRSTVVVNHDCIPVYGLKHKDLVAAVRQGIVERELPIRICGNSYDGVSLSDCVNSAYNAIESFHR